MDGTQWFPNGCKLFMWRVNLWYPRLPGQNRGLHFREMIYSCELVVKLVLDSWPKTLVNRRVSILQDSYQNQKWQRSYDTATTRFGSYLQPLASVLPQKTSSKVSRYPCCQYLLWFLVSMQGFLSCDSKSATRAQQCPDVVQWHFTGISELFSHVSTLGPSPHTTVCSAKWS